MYKVGICGHFGGNRKILDGQTIKTKILTDELRKNVGKDEVKIVDTYGWKKGPLKCPPLSRHKFDIYPNTSFL